MTRLTTSAGVAPSPIDQGRETATPSTRDTTLPTIVPVPLNSLPAAAAAWLPRSTKASVIGPEGAPLIVVLGGISANLSVVCTADGGPGWWANLFGRDALLGPERYRILGIDFVADEAGGYAPDTFDQASIIADALDAIGAAEPAAIVGASYGGMVALAYAERFQPRSTRLVIISAGAAPHPMATAARSLQRQVVDLGLAHGCGGKALAIARGMAMLTYRTRREFGERFAGGIEGDDPLGLSEPRRYLDARGRAYLEVMSPGRFLSLSASIDRHHVSPETIGCPALVIGVEEDQVVPLEDLAELAARLGGPTQFRAVCSIYGHDAFLKEPERIGGFIAAFLETPLPGEDNTPTERQSA